MHHGQPTNSRDQAARPPRARGHAASSDWWEGKESTISTDETYTEPTYTTHDGKVFTESEIKRYDEITGDNFDRDVLCNSARVREIIDAAVHHKTSRDYGSAPAVPRLDLREIYADETLTLTAEEALTAMETFVYALDGPSIPPGTDVETKCRDLWDKIAEWASTEESWRERRDAIDAFDVWYEQNMPKDDAPGT